MEENRLDPREEREKGGKGKKSEERSSFWKNIDRDVEE